MNGITVVTREVGIHAFQAGIFLSDADLISPVEVYARNQEPQSLQESFDEQKTQPPQWMTYAGPAGIGQYSLKRGKSAGVLARVDAYFRYPTEKEMQYDFKNFGEQVLGPAVAEVSENEREKCKNNKTFKIWKEDHYFIGPLRLIKSLFLSRVFSGEVPQDISRLVREVDEMAETGEVIVAQNYQFLHSTGGKMIYSPFRKIEEYAPSKLKSIGFVEIENGRMTYHLKEDRSHPIDFTDAMRN